MKRFYRRTNKNRFEKQIGKHERRQARLQAINQAVACSVALDNIPADLLNKDNLPFTSPKVHHHMSKSKAIPLNIFKWVQVNRSDPAIEVSTLGLSIVVTTLTNPTFQIGILL
jgi:hypothetical protein